ncbi:type II secretion system protein N [Kordiimonas pumila]|uniref:Type II secretion system protein N n=1 Tax=Kordiimonas pumila TaxID=2161677 RepID=A0ABV7D765_9PROT|nr:type II secretion system protein N [Kordiimonas pumila]
MLIRNKETSGGDHKSDTSTAAKAAHLFTSVPLWLRGLVVCTEIILVLALGYFSAGWITGYQAEENWQMPVVPHAAKGVPLHSKAPAAISGFDPFYRTIVQKAATGKAAPESSMKIAIFGLRTDKNGGGSAILKVGDDPQQLVQLGGAIKPGVTLTGIFNDRIEISRSGVRETVYMYPASARKTPQPQGLSTSNGRSVAGAELAGLVQGLALTPAYSGGRIAGFQVGIAASDPSLQALSLEPDDIVLSVNDIALVSFERLTELADELNGVRRVSFTYERRGEKRVQTIPVVW